MKLDYTEFSFGYAFTENLIRSTSSGAGTAPVFPNLRQEARAGYDVHINLPGFPLYLQYKLPDLMVRYTAKEILRYDLPGLHLPFFRMYLMQRNQSDQHETLIELEESFPGSVYYVAPCMMDIDHFNDMYISANVHQCSVFFSPNEIGHLPDDRQHSIAYCRGMPVAWLCSEPREIGFYQSNDIFMGANSSMKVPHYRTLREAAYYIREGIIPIVSSKIQARESEIRQLIQEERRNILGQTEIDSSTEQVIEDLLVSREIARIGLGLDLIIAQPTMQ